MSDSVLVLSNIYKSYFQGTPKEINVLQGIDLTVEKGEIIALVAPSGAGKSTLLHIAGLLRSNICGWRFEEFKFGPCSNKYT